MPTCGPRQKDGNASAGYTPSRHAVAQERKMETRVWTVCRVDKRPRQERWKRMCGVLVTPTGGTGKKDGNARSRCSRCCLASIVRRWKRAVGLFATWSSRSGKKDGNVSLDCSQCRHANQETRMETRVWAACQVEMRFRKGRGKRVCGLFVASTRGSGKKTGNALNKRLKRAFARLRAKKNCGNA